MIMGDAPESASPFAVLLRRHRLRLHLTQEALAERAGLSSRSVAEMERGRGRSPRPRSVEQLTVALELTGDERAEFVDAGRALFWASRAGRPDRRTPAGGDVRAVDLPPRQLPADLPDFVGRVDELSLLGAVLDPAAQRDARLVALSGPPGVGKTALAVHAGHRFASWFPAGQLYVALRGAGGDPVDPAEVLAQLLRVLGVDGSTLPAGVDARAGLFRTRLAGRQVLLVLDDADGYRQVEPLIPAKEVAVVVTSRLPLTGLPGVSAIDLQPLPGPQAVELLCQVAGRERVQAEPAAAAELVTACGGLPLAVRIAAARLAARPHWMVSTLNKRLADERRRLDELRHGDLAVRPGLYLAYRGLTSGAARAFGLLGELSVPSFPEWSVGALLGVDPVEGTAVLEELLDARLLESLGPDRAGQPRYRLHDVTRLYARERRQAETSAEEWTAALARAAAEWLARARQAQDGLHCLRLYLDDRGDPVQAAGGDEPVEWFEAERQSLAALVTACAEVGLAAAARSLAGCSADFYELRSYYDDWQRAMRVAGEACRRAGDRTGEAAMLRGLGTCMSEFGDREATLSVLRAARTLAEEVGDQAGVALTSHEIGFILGLQGSLDKAEVELGTAAKRLEAVGLPLARAIALTSLGFVRRQRGDTAEAVDTIRGGLSIARSRGNLFVEAYTLRGLAGALLACDRAEEAEQAARRAATLFERIGDLAGAAQGLRALGEALAHQSHREAEAEQALTAAADLFRDRGHEWGLALTELSLGEIEARRGDPAAAARLHQALRYWSGAQVPALRARALVALATTAEQVGDDPAAWDFLLEAYHLYQALEAPAADDLAARLGLSQTAGSVERGGTPDS
ncbi:ATP-binding protein [Nonomuraea sp. NPDC050536]|uniref:ATP-binding protein n=1 Tax=Nonomuraea sp. NPDC050536 TaxID=3364366 RepID=UPI0037C7B54F